MKILIRDEISMIVGSDLLLQIHNNLCKITSINEPFGGISILTFGDLFQLLPGMQHFVFKPSRDHFNRIYGNLWAELTLYEMT